MVWYTAVQRIGSSRTAIYSNLTPIIAMIVAAIWLGEQITRSQILGAVFILSGIAITRLAPARA
jgi:drug/metabolite transporter (DMT)-like permease